MSAFFNSKTTFLWRTIGLNQYIWLGNGLWPIMPITPPQILKLCSFHTLHIDEVLVRRAATFQSCFSSQFPLLPFLSPRKCGFLIITLLIEAAHSCISESWNKQTSSFYLLYSDIVSCTQNRNEFQDNWNFILDQPVVNFQ